VEAGSDVTAADRTLADMTGRRGEGRWSAPGRVNLIGEHLDYNGGPVLPIAIDRRTSVTAELRGDDRVSVTSDSEDATVAFTVASRPGDVEGWGAYVAGVFWALGQAGHELPGLDLQVRSDVPIGAGLSSSAALGCAVAVALRDLARLDIGDVELAVVAQHAENDYVGVPSGAMDQLASMCGSVGHAVLIDTIGPSVELVPVTWSRDGVTLLVVDTAARHSLRDGEYAVRRRQCDDAAAALEVAALAVATPGDLVRLDPVLFRRASHVVSEAARVRDAVTAVREANWTRLGEIFTASHTSLRDDFEVSSAELDTAVAAALDAGALGARMTGGGFGGSAITLVPDERADAVAQRCRVVFAAAGWADPTVFAVVPSAGAGRES